MYLTVYRHLSIPWLVMRDGMRFMPEGSGKFEVVGHAGTVRRRVHTAAKQLRRKLGDDANNPTYIFTEPRVGYRMEKGEALGQEEA